MACQADTVHAPGSSSLLLILQPRAMCTCENCPCQQERSLELSSYSHKTEHHRHRKVYPHKGVLLKESVAARSNTDKS